MRRIVVVITSVSLLSGAIGCQGKPDPSTQQKLDRLEKNTLRLGKQLTETINRLEKQVEALGARVARIERGAVAGSARASANAGAGGVRRSMPMSPDLQRQLDKLIVGGLSKLSKNQNARDAANAMLKMLAEAFKKEAKRVEKAAP